MQRSVDTYPKSISGRLTKLGLLYMSNVELTEKQDHAMDWVGLREFIERAENLDDEIEHIDGAHWDLEMSTISHELCRGPRDPIPAPIFDNIPDYPEGHRTMYGMTNSMNRLAIALGMEPNYTHEMDFLQDYREKQKEIENINTIEPEFLDPDDAPLMENVQKGDDVDLFSVPVPKHHDKDGGRYIGTATSFITPDPDTGRVNHGAYRVQAHSENECGVYISPGKHGAVDIKEHWERGERVPVAASFGQDPSLFFFTSIGLNHGEEHGEYAHAGGLKGRPFPVVEGPVTGLPLPARGEIVIEGFIEPNSTHLEGPFGEWQGYYGRDADDEPLVNVEAMYHRDNPILTCAVPAKPPYDYTYHKALARGANLWEQLETAGVPAIEGVWRTEAGGSRLFNIISIDQQYPGHARQAGMVAQQCRAGGYANRWTVVVDEDIDPTDWQEVAWAMSTRCNPKTDIEVTDRTWSTPLDPLVEKAGTEPGKKNLTFNSRAMVDATIPYERLETFPEVAEAPQDYQEEIKDKWGDVIYGRD